MDVMAVGTPGGALVARLVLVVVGVVVVSPLDEELEDVAREVSNARQLERRDDRENLEDRQDQHEAHAPSGAHGVIVPAPATGASS